MKKIKNTLINDLGDLCKKHHLTLVTTESCTGGGLAFELSKCKMCSSNLERGYITYSNQSKESVLGVNLDTILLKGAVSEEVAIEMAEGALKKSLAQVSVSITGIAGEDSSKEKEGQAWIAISMIDYLTLTKKVEFTGNRKKFIEFVIEKSIRFLYESIKNQYDK